MRKRMEELEGLPPEKVNPFFWAFSWLIFWGAIWFCIYWVFAWGATNSGETMNLWGSGYGVAVVQDVMVCECIKLLVMFCLAPMNARPQLQVIRRVINDAALTFVQQGAGDDRDVRVVQHFSPACRAAHLGGVNTLAASAILRNLTDADLERCREFKNFSVSILLLVFIMFFAVVALLGEAVFDQLVDIINNVCWNGFVMANGQFYMANPLGLFFLWGATGCCVLYYFGVFTPNIVEIRDIYAKYCREFGASHAHVSGPSQYIAGRLPPTSVLLHKRSKAHLKREGHAQTWLQEWHRFRHVTWMRFMFEFQLWILIIVGEHWAVEKRRSHEYDEIWSRMNKATAVRPGNIGEDNGHDEEQYSTTSDTKLQQHKNFKISIHSQSYSESGHVELPGSILNMRPSGLGIKRDTIEGLLEEKKWAKKLFGANENDNTNTTNESKYHKGRRNASIIHSLFPIVYKNKAPGDLPLNLELDITTDPKRALRRMLLMLQANSNSGGTGVSNLLVFNSRHNDNNGQSIVSAANTAFSVLNIGGLNRQKNNEEQLQQQQHRKKQSPARHHRHHCSSVHPTYEENPTTSTTVSVFDSGDPHYGNVQVLMCEFSVLLSWIWESFWPGGGPLSTLEQAEVMERFDDWRKAIQASRKPSVGQKVDDMWDPDHDYGTTFTVFAGWFLALVSYLNKVREVEKVYEKERDNLIDVIVDDETIDEITQQKAEKKLAYREIFLPRREQSFVSPTSSETPSHIAQQEQFSTEDMDMDSCSDDEETKTEERKIHIRERFLTRRKQGYAPLLNTSLNTSAMAPAVREALIDSYFGRMPPIVVKFDWDYSQEEMVKDMPIVQKSLLINRKQFLCRVQVSKMKIMIQEMTEKIENKPSY